MIRHEKKCSSNPDNHRDCFDCSHCVKVPIEYEGDNTGGMMRSSSTFKCSKKNIFMYPPKFEHSDQSIPYAEHEGEEIVQEKMKQDCDEYDVDFPF